MGMKTSSVIMALLFALSLGLSLALISCDSEGDEYRKHDFTQTDSNNYAKDKLPEQVCGIDDLYIADCLDACTCCHQGAGDILEDCVMDCDVILIRYQKYPPAHTDITNYKECVLGCWSVCDKPDKMVTCWDECNIYVDA